MKPLRASKSPERLSETVPRALSFLAANQCEDGHWEGDGGQHPVAMTGLVGFALLMQGSGSGREGEYALNIRKAADWLMDLSEARRDGLIFSGHPSESVRYMIGHGLATIFLVTARKDDYDENRRKRLDEVLARAVNCIASAQTTQGGWYGTSKLEGHDFAEVLATAIQVQALQAVENSHLDVPFETLDFGQDYLQLEVEKGSSPADLAAALACRVRHNLLLSRSEVCRSWLRKSRFEISLGCDIELGRDELTHYYYAQAVRNLGDTEWKELFKTDSEQDCLTWTRYRNALLEHLEQHQDEDGGWPGSEGISVGRVYATAVWSTILQLDQREHPSNELRMKPRR
jgi:hypothetical protein